MKSYFDVESDSDGTDGASKSQFLTLLGLCFAALTLWTRKEPLPLWVAVSATTLLALGILYVYSGILFKWLREIRSRWRLHKAVNILKPRMLDFLTSLSRFIDRERMGSFMRIVEDINQLPAVQTRRLVAGDTSHLYTLTRFGQVVRTQAASMSKGSDVLEVANAVYTIFWEYNSFVGQVHNRLQSIIQELSKPLPDGVDRSKEDEAVRVIRTKWNSFRDLQNAFVQAGAQLGEEIKRDAGQVSWGTHAEHYQTLE